MKGNRIKKYVEIKVTKINLKLIRWNKDKNVNPGNNLDMLIFPIGLKICFSEVDQVLLNGAVDPV